MIDRSIVIHNVYVMLAYAFRAVRTRNIERLDSEEFEHLHDLLAEILVQGVGAQIKRGLFHDYVPRTEELLTVRGQIDLGQTLKRQSRSRGRVVCNFDEYLPDVPHNQALKSVITLLLKHGEVDRKRKSALRRVLPYLEDVTLVSPAAIRWKDLHYHRANASYRLLLGVCELIIRGLLPTENSGSSKLNSWFSEDAMSALYEKFLREYFIFHHPELSPSAPTIDWDFDVSSALGAYQLPKMKTDLTLRNGARTLIIDAKYYGESLQTHHHSEKATINSANLYQILSYVKNEDISRSGGVAGLLLYAQTDATEQPQFDAIIQGNRIGAQALDLNKPWPELREQLEALVDWIPSGTHIN